MLTDGDTILQPAYEALVEALQAEYGHNLTQEVRDDTGYMALLSVPDDGAGSESGDGPGFNYSLGFSGSCIKVAVEFDGRDRTWDLASPGLVAEIASWVEEARDEFRFGDRQ